MATNILDIRADWRRPCRGRRCTIPGAMI